MQIKAEINMSEIERLLSNALRDEYPDMFQSGATITWRATDNQRDGTVISATATPNPKHDGKD